jgi:hypothetical protein
MRNCESLNKINISGLSNLKLIGNNCMKNCTNLKKIILTKEYYDKYDEQIIRRLLRYEAILEFV